MPRLSSVERDLCSPWSGRGVLARARKEAEIYSPNAGWLGRLLAEDGQREVCDGSSAGQAGFLKGEGKEPGEKVRARWRGFITALRDRETGNQDGGNMLGNVALFFSPPCKRASWTTGNRGEGDALLETAREWEWEGLRGLLGDSGGGVSASRLDLMEGFNCAAPSSRCPGLCRGRGTQIIRGVISD